MSDQAARLRALVAARRGTTPRPAPTRPAAATIAVVGARRGVGSSTVVSALREALAARCLGGWRVCELPAGADGARAAAALAPGLVLVVSTPEPPSVLGAYAACKVLARTTPTPRLGVVVTRARSLPAATAVAGRIVAVARRFLNCTVDLLGRVPEDAAVPAAATGDGRLRTIRPLGAAARAFDELARACGPGPVVARPTPETPSAAAAVPAPALATR